MILTCAKTRMRIIVLDIFNLLSIYFGSRQHSKLPFLNKIVIFMISKKVIHVAVYFVRWIPMGKYLFWYLDEVLCIKYIIICTVQNLFWYWSLLDYIVWKPFIMIYFNSINDVIIRMILCHRFFAHKWHLRSSNADLFKA